MHWQVVSAPNAVDFSWYYCIYQCINYTNINIICRIDTHYYCVYTKYRIYNQYLHHPAGAYSGIGPGGLHFFHHPLGPETPLKSIDFTGRGGLSPHSHLPRVWNIKFINIWKMCKQTGFLKNAILDTTAFTIVRWQRQKGKLPTVIICCANAFSLTPMVDSPVSNDYIDGALMLIDGALMLGKLLRCNMIKIGPSRELCYSWKGVFETLYV